MTSRRNPKLKLKIVLWAPNQELLHRYTGSGCMSKIFYNLIHNMKYAVTIRCPNYGQTQNNFKCKTTLNIVGAANCFN